MILRPTGSKLHPRREPASLQTPGLLRAQETCVLPQKRLSTSRAGRCILPSLGSFFCSFLLFPVSWTKFSHPLLADNVPRTRPPPPSRSRPEWPPGRFPAFAVRGSCPRVPAGPTWRPNSCLPRRPPPRAPHASSGLQRVLSPLATPVGTGSCVGAGEAYLWLFPLVYFFPVLI